MFENRIGKFFDAAEFIPANAGTLPAFIACPIPLLANYSQAQQSFVAEIYRRALELTESQMRKPAKRKIPEFSMN
jgi:hypothetical protein